MPDTDDAATTDAAPAPTYTFPFPVPDLATTSDADLIALHQQVRDHGAELAGVSPAERTADTVTALRACRDLALAIAAQLSDRRALAADVDTLADEIAGIQVDAAAVEDDEEDDGTAEADAADADASTAPAAQPVAVTAASGRRSAPRVRDVARGAGAPQVPATARRVYASMTAAADIAGFASGTQYPTFRDAARALQTRLDQYPALTTGRSRAVAGRRPVTVYDPDAPGRRLQLKNYTRHSVVELRRDYPDELRVRDGGLGTHSGYSVAEYAASERRLPGGSLLKSAELAVASGRSLTAAAGWCAPSETIYDLMELETQEGLLDVPELQTDRGGWQIPINGGPDFATIYGELGNAGDTHLTEDDVIADTAKVCTEIPCPDFEDIRLGVDYYCLTGGLLQRRGYPEAVARFSRAAVVALAHKINQGFLAAMVTGSSGALTIPSDPSGDDAASALLAAVELAIVDAQYRHRMAFTQTMEIVLPRWVLVVIRAALSRRTGIGLLGVTDAMILEWFTMRHAVPRFVYDWQDAFSSLVGGPGAATGLTHLPTTVEFLVYPAGTWVKAVQDVVALDTIYDSTLLTTNQYTAVFVEDGWAALKMGPLSRRYVVPVDPSGVVGCCSPVGS